MIIAYHYCCSKQNRNISIQNKQNFRNMLVHFRKYKRSQDFSRQIKVIKLISFSPSIDNIPFILHFEMMNDTT